MTEVNPVGISSNVAPSLVTKILKPNDKDVYTKELFKTNGTENYMPEHIDNTEKALADIDKMANLPNTKMSKDEFLAQYGDSPICNVGFNDLTKEEAEFVLKIQNNFGNNNNMTVKEYLKSKDFNPRFLQLILDKGIVYNDENEDCKPDPDDK